MVDKILTAAQIEHAETVFIEQPEGVFAVYGDRITADGSDERLHFLQHDVVVELYEPAQWVGREERERLISALNQAYKDGRIEAWECEVRIWLQDMQLFMTTFNFSYYTRR